MQTGPVLLGQYRPNDSFLHRLDARSKLLPVVLVLALALFTSSAWFYIAVLISLIAGLLMAGVTPEALARSFRPMLILVAITFLYHLIFSGRGTPALATVFGWTIRQGAVHDGVFYSLRFILFLSMAFLVTLTTSPSDLAEAAARLLRPLRRFRVPINNLALILYIAIRFIPILYEEFMTIRNAQMIRGVDFSGPLIKRIRRTLYLITPVFVAAVNRADDLALALHARGYRSRAERTFYSRASIGIPEVIFMVMATSAIAILFVVTV